jgi:ABC-type glutathione transport system ATPase component
MFDVPPSEMSGQKWECSLPVEEKPWNIGLIVGPSGCGKSSLARKLWPDKLDLKLEWPRDKAIVDGFGRELGIKAIVEALSSVGFSSPPSWLRPFHVLSNGEQFRATLARTIAESGQNHC